MPTTSSPPLSLLHRSSGSSVLPLVFPAHFDFIPRPLSTLPEPPSTSLPNKHTMAETAILRSVVSFPTAPPTNHAISPFIRMVLFIVMALIARVHLLATAEAKPSIALHVVATAASLWKFCARGQP